MRVRLLSSGLVFASLVLAGLAFPGLAAPAHAQENEVLYRVERLENQLRQMTGEIEQLQYRNQQLEAALNELRGGRPAAAAPLPGAGAGMAPPLQQGSMQTATSAPGTSHYGAGRHGDAFDPSDSPGAPGAPRQLGAMPPQPPPPNTRPGMQPTPYAGGGAPDQGYGRPPGGAPQPAAYPAATTAMPPQQGSPPPGAPPPTVPQGIQPQGTQPQGSPQEAYEAGVGHLKHRDYAAAQEAFRDFVTRYPSDRMAAEAQYYLGESLFQSQNYQEAADAFVQLSKRFESSTRVPDGLLRLGQSLAAMNETELACVAFADISRKYPRARAELRQAVEREQKRARCSPA